ncbi:hypothetical protein SE956_00230 [Escherichia coli]|nr:hypothetical protein [Escherichia coli]
MEHLISSIEHLLKTASPENFFFAISYYQSATNPLLNGILCWIKGRSAGDTKDAILPQSQGDVSQLTIKKPYVE